MNENTRRIRTTFENGEKVRVVKGDQSGEIGYIRDIEISKHEHQEPLYLVGNHWYAADRLERTQ